MSPQQDSLLQRVQSSYARLAAIAQDLNGVSDDLGKAIQALDNSLKKLNLGVTSWYTFCDDGPFLQDRRFLRKYIGYARIGSRWGIALSRSSGHADANPEENLDEEWLFNDAPRELRLESIEHIPAMIDKLIEAGEAAVDRVKEKTSEVRQLAEALTVPKQASKPVQRNPQS